MEGKWEYLSDSPPWFNGRWKKFELNLSNIFEGCFANGISSVSFIRDGKKYNACLHKMEQYDSTAPFSAVHSQIRRLSGTCHSIKVWSVKPKILGSLGQKINVYEIKRNSKNRLSTFTDISRDNQEFEFASLYFNRLLNKEDSVHNQVVSREILQGTEYCHISAFHSY